MWVDDDHKYLWWGTNCAYWCDLADLVADKTKVSWYSGTDWKKASKPRFVWWLSDDVEEKSSKLSKEVAQPELQKDSPKQWKPSVQRKEVAHKELLVVSTTKASVQWKEAAPKELHVESATHWKEFARKAVYNEPATHWKEVTTPQELRVNSTKRRKEVAPRVDSAKTPQRPALDPSDFPPGLPVPPHLQNDTTKHSQQVLPGLEALAANPVPTSDSKGHEHDECDTTCSDSDKEVSSRLGSAELSHSHTSDEEFSDGPSENVQPFQSVARRPDLSEMPMTKLAFTRTVLCRNEHLLQALTYSPEVQYQ